MTPSVFLHYTGSMGYALQVRISKEEEGRYKAAARAAGLGLSAWARGVLNLGADERWPPNLEDAVVNTEAAWRKVFGTQESELVATQPSYYTDQPDVTKSDKGPCLGQPPPLATCHLCGLKHEAP